MISEKGEWLGVAQKLKKEGHNITFATQYPSRIGENIVETPINLSLIKSDLTINTYNIDRLIKKCLPELIIFAGNNFNGLIATYINTNFRIPCYGSGAIVTMFHNYSVFGKKMWKKFDLVQGEVGGIWNGNEFTYCFEWLNEGNFIGRNSGVDVEAGGVGRLINDKTIIDKLIPMLSKHYYRGGIILNKDRIIFFTPLSFFEVYTGSLASFFIQNATIQKPNGKVLEDLFFAQNLISLPPYPFINKENSGMCDEMIVDFEKESLKHIWLEDVRSEGGTFKCTSHTGRLGYITARGNAVQEVVRRIYRTININHSQFSCLQYRTDLGSRASAHFGL